MSKTYESPFNSRYASKEMLELFSDDNKFKTWRRLWIALAESQKELGLNISKEQIDELKMYKDDINFDEIRIKEKEIRHDVMAHIYGYGEQCPNAKPIIHLGATSCYVGDNTDLILMYEGLKLIKRKIINVINNLSNFAQKYKDMPTLGFTHFQPAQLVTVGKRACLWIQDLLMDLERIEYELKHAKLLGSKGTTGTQASFMTLFDNNHEKVKQLDKLIAKNMGYNDVFAVSGQTYPRKQDSIILNLLSGVAVSCYKFADDIRLLQHLKEIEEPFLDTQVGSSAMAYKRNPMQSERICGIARFVMVNSLNTDITASVQWLERSLDDSSNKRITIPESFLAVDAILNIYINITSGLNVYEKVINQHIINELPFMATEEILMNAVKKGGDRQIIHEKIRMHSMEAAKRVKHEGLDNDLIDRIKADESFNLTEVELNDIMNPQRYIGRAPRQVEEFLESIVKPILEQNKHLIGGKVEISV